MFAPESDEPQVSVVVPIHDNAATIGRVVRAFLGQLDRVARGELIVVDDGSTDGPDRELAEVARDPRLRFVRNEPARGAAAARNRGIDLARGAILILSDGDCVPCGAFIAAHLEAHRRYQDERYAVLGNLRYPPDVTVTPLMRLGNVVEFWGGRSSIHPGNGEEVPSGESKDFTLFRTTNISLKRRFLGERFAETMGVTSGWEDTDLGLRLAARGMVVVAARDAISWHHHFLDRSQYLDKAYRYGRLFRRWLERLDPEARREVRARLSFHFDARHPFSLDNLRRLRKKVVVNALTIHPLLWLARALERRNERLSASLYWKVYPHVFLRGYRERPIRGIASGARP